jgi:hypothetical protein
MRPFTFVCLLLSALLLSPAAGSVRAGAEPPLFLADSQFGDSRSSIFTVDPATGELTLQADLGSSYTPILGLAAADAQVLYATGSDSTESDRCQGMRSCLLMKITLPVPAVSSDQPAVSSIQELEEASTVSPAEPARGALQRRLASASRLAEPSTASPGPSSHLAGDPPLLETPSELAGTAALLAAVEVIGPVHAGETIIGEIVGLNFREDGHLYATSQEDGGLYVIDPETAAATLVGIIDLEIHGGDVTVDGHGRIWTWSNIGAGTGLYELDPVTAAASAFELHPDLGFAGLAALAHTNLMYGAHPPGDLLYEIDSTLGMTGNTVPLSLDGAHFDHKRGDLDSPFCIDDLACADDNACTQDTCSPGGCRSAEIPDCCVADPECDDGNLCTINRCQANACVSVPVPTAECLLESVCPCDGPGDRPWKNHGEYVQCAVRATRALASSRAVRVRTGSVVREAARSSCGR